MAKKKCEICGGPLEKDLPELAPDQCLKCVDWIYEKAFEELRSHRRGGCGQGGER